MSHAVALVTDDRNRVRAQMPVHLRSPWITPDHESRPRQEIAERVAARSTPRCRGQSPWGGARAKCARLFVGLASYPQSPCMRESRSR